MVRPLTDNYSRTAYALCDLAGTWFQTNIIDHFDNARLHPGNMLQQSKQRITRRSH